MVDFGGSNGSRGPCTDVTAWTPTDEGARRCRGDRVQQQRRAAHDHKLEGRGCVGWLMGWLLGWPVGWVCGSVSASVRHMCMDGHVERAAVVRGCDMMPASIGTAHALLKNRSIDQSTVGWGSRQLAICQYNKAAAAAAATASHHMLRAAAKQNKRHPPQHGCLLGVSVARLRLLLSSALLHMESAAKHTCRQAWHAFPPPIPRSHIDRSKPNPIDLSTINTHTLLGRCDRQPNVK